MMVFMGLMVVWWAFVVVHSVDVPHSAVLSPRHFLESEPALSQIDYLCAERNRDVAVYSNCNLVGMNEAVLGQSGNGRS